MKESTQRVCVRGVLVVDDEVLLIKRASPGSHEGYFEVPGGRLVIEEDLEESAIREFKEETGVDVVVKDYIRDFTWVNHEGLQRVEIIFQMSLGGDQDFSKDSVVISQEHSEFKWVDWNSLDELKITDDIKKGIRKVLPKKDNVVNGTTDFDELIIYTDGGSRGNPGPSASGFVIMTTNEEIIDEGGEYLGITTNNQAEYRAVVLALKSALKHGSTNLKFYIDSLLVVNQLNGTWRIKHAELKPVYDEIKQLVDNYKSVTFTHVRREYNKMADAKVNEVLDAVSDISHD